MTSRRRHCHWHGGSSYSCALTVPERTIDLCDSEYNELEEEVNEPTNPPWNDKRPWHVATPPTKPHILGHTEKTLHGETVVRYEFNIEKVK